MQEDFHLYQIEAFRQFIGCKAHIVCCKLVARYDREWDHSTRCTSKRHSFQSADFDMSRKSNSMKLQSILVVFTHKKNIINRVIIQRDDFNSTQSCNNTFWMHFSHLIAVCCAHICLALHMDQKHDFSIICTVRRIPHVFNRCVYDYCCCCVLFRPMISIYSLTVLLLGLVRRSVWIIRDT